MLISNLMNLEAQDGMFRLYFQVQDWLSFRNTELHGLSEAQLLKVCFQL